MRASRIVLAACLLAVMASPLFALEVSVKDHGAKGDGKTDDRLAIQAAIDAVNKAGGGIVNFPEGVYIVTAPNKEPKWKPQVKLCSHLKLQGVGMLKSVIKMADNQGAYDTIFAGEAIEGFSMLDLAIDSNGETNPVISTKDEQSPYLHTPVYLPLAKNVAIQRCRFTNLSGVWAVYLPGRAENVVIDSCLFDNIGGYTKDDWDHSCIRVDGYGPCVISNNQMATRFGAGTTGARTAVEIHGSNHKFINNLITGFRYGINVCSGGDDRVTEPSVHQYYINNKLVNVGCGFAIWGIQNRRFDNLVFERNDITIDIAGWKKFFPEFYGIGIVSYRGQEPPTLMENVRIVDNQITFVNLEGGTTRSFGMRFDFSIYTDGWSENPSGQMTNVVILRNTISGAFAGGIDLNCVAKNFTISGNTIIDPARGVKEKDLQCAIRLRDSLENVGIVNNAFYSDKPKALACGIYDAANTLNGCVQTNNRMAGSATADVPVYQAAPNRKGAEWKTRQQ